MSSTRNLKLALYGATAIGSSGYGVMFVVLDKYRDRYHIPGSSVGLLVAAGFITAFLTQIFLGPLGDKGHAKSLVMLGSLIQIVGMCAMGFGKVFPILLTGRILMGIGSGLCAPALRRILILLAPDELGNNLGTLLSVDVGGFCMGPVVALIFGSFGLHAPYLFLCLCLSAVMIPLSRAKIDESKRHNDQPRFALGLLKNKGVAAATLVGLALFTMIGTFDAVWSLMMTDLKADTWIKNLGITFFALPLILLGAQGGKICQRFGPLRMSIAGIFVGSCFMVLYGFLTVPLMMLAVGVVHGINDGITATGAGISLGGIVEEKNQAASQGLFGGAQALAGGLSATAAGWGYEHGGRFVTFAVCSCVTLTLATSAFIIGHSGGYLKGKVTTD